MIREWSYVLGIGLLWSAPTVVLAAEGEGTEGESAEQGEVLEESAEEPAAAPDEPGEEAAPKEPTAEKPTEEQLERQDEEAEAVEDALDQGPTELEGKTYMFIGARYRNVTIPKFVQNFFADGGESLFAHTPGLEFAIRQDGFEYGMFAMLGFYAFDDVPFKGSSDDELAWEIISADYKVLYLGSDFMWSTDEFAPGLSMVYGAGAGLGLVFGDLNRVQAYPPGGIQGDPETYLPCNGIGDPAIGGAYCDDENDHYPGYVEPTWANGGSSPILFPWLAAQIGLRYKFNRQFATRFEVGVMPTGAFIGLAGQYGL